MAKDVLSLDLTKTQRPEISVQSFPLYMEFDSLSSTTTEAHAKFQSNMNMYTTKPVELQILWDLIKDVLPKCCPQTSGASDIANYCHVTHRLLSK